MKALKTRIHALVTLDPVVRPLFGVKRVPLTVSTDVCAEITMRLAFAPKIKGAYGHTKVQSRAVANVAGCIADASRRGLHQHVLLRKTDLPLCA